METINSFWLGRYTFEGYLMRRIITLFTSVALAFSGLVFSPAMASTISTVQCGGDVTDVFTITGTVVTDEANCEGAVEIPPGVTEIGRLAFSSSGITSITIPASVTNIGDSAFDSASSLTSINFAPGSQLRTIEANAFLNTFSLESIIIPASVTSIGPAAFVNATSLESVTFAPGSQLNAIGSGAFSQCTQLVAITIPAGVLTIGEAAFQNSSELIRIYFLGDAPAVDTNAFFGVKSGAIAYGVSDFNMTGANWSPLTFAVGVYTATYSSNGGTSVDFDRFISGGNIATAPTPPTRTNYIFDSWSTTDGGSAISFPYTPASAGDITFYSKWVIDPAYVAAQAAAAADLAARTVSAKKKYVVKSLAKKTGVTIVSSKAKVTFKVAKSSKKICTKSGSKLKTLKAGNCVVTFTVQEPKPKKGKKPKATKTVKTLVVQ